MAESTDYRLPTSGSVAKIATDDCTVNGEAVRVQRMKAGFGVDGSYTDVSSTDPLPVYFVSAQGINIAQFGGTAVTLGQKAMTASVPVVLASDQTVIPASQSGTWNIGTVTTMPVWSVAGLPPPEAVSPL